MSVIKLKTGHILRLIDDITYYCLTFLSTQHVFGREKIPKTSNIFNIHLHLYINIVFKIIII